MRTAAFVFVMMLSSVGMAQERSYRLIDAGDASPLPYASVHFHGSTRGTITNEEGYFSLPDDLASDTLRITFVGYRTLLIAVSELPANGSITLERTTISLGEFTVHPGKLPYDRVMAAARWLQRAPLSEARLFFGMETYSDSLPVEMIHAYYNAQYRSARLEGLDLKQGRIGLAGKSGRFFINYNTTRAFALIDILSRRSLFPTSPLAMNGTQEMKRLFLAELISEGQGPDAVDHLRVAPRNAASGAFTVELWMDHGSDRVRSVELSCEACSKHPFLPLFEHGRIDTVDLHVRQAWSADEVAIPEVMELEYRMVYSGPGFTDEFRTHAVMHAFDRSAPFILPFFTYVSDLPDYRKIGWLPDDSLFWARMHPPLPTARQERDMDFLLANDLRGSSWYSQLGEDRNFFAAHYGLWSPEHRIWLRELSTNVPKEGFKRVDDTGFDGNVLLVAPPPVELVAQLYLDLDLVNGELVHRSATVLDGFQSYDLVADQAWNAAFHNIWFDLCELERRSMEQRLDEPGLTMARARAIHAEHTLRLKAMTQQYLLDTGHGDSFVGIGPWNKKVKDALGIDNLKMFGL